ncbi:hypothetical protein M837_00847 [Streptococcus equi subsp. zooepidemicus SzS31A1]|uniref:Uncharacterized protein n=2 Tax=Streptococcus equi subsp. zooepidemicus TaxID=40041 RepID=A0ABN0MW33_STRSZ|nr:hypothetical protein [Streptococcus equi]KIS17723.1 hypothetical protein AT55_01567 [Streptococcus equi subsp. zooepidemicus Sz4is]EQB23728.1 hypothetical protein M837_00847 [Streptococcus equi subsp. zooepidemicus SzS31A1]KIS06778.1 hypothetical protein AT54_01463 [Streptococcus equi subsp. zooepidemicus Sz12is]MCD3416229.1 hypothetical protein [Streptococcus equi subsp. zooepidemicus]MCD3462359.1 hypothetical protein [Streptococcus equi subsp. zooepidemicus]
MDDYEAKQNLIKLGEKLRQQTFWGLIPETPEWEFDELGAYLPTISLPAFINNLTVKNDIMSYVVTSFEQFTKHTEIYEINTTIGEFTAKLQAIINSQTEQEFCQNLLEVLRTEVYFVKEWDN